MHALALGLALLVASGPDDTPTEVLAQKGLTRDKTRYRLDESAVLEAFEKAKVAVGNAREATATATGGRNVAGTVKNLQAQFRELNVAITQQDALVRTFPKPKFRSREQAAAVVELEKKKALRNELKATLGDSKGQVPNDRQAGKTDNDAAALMAQAEDAVDDLRATYLAMDEHYRELATDPDVRQALKEVGAKNVTYKVEPSKTFGDIGRWLKPFKVLSQKELVLKHLGRAHASATELDPPKNGKIKAELRTRLISAIEATIKKAEKGQAFDEEAKAAEDACDEHLKTPGFPIDKKRLEEARRSIGKAVEVAHRPARRA